MSALSKQVGADAYKTKWADWAIQPVEFIQRNRLSFIVGCVVKYVCRYQHKNGREDLEKARHYIDLLLEIEYGEEIEEKAAEQETEPDSEGTRFTFLTGKKAWV